MNMKRETDLLVKSSVPLILAALALYAAAYFLEASILNNLASFLLLVGGASYALGYSNKKADVFSKLGYKVPYKLGAGRKVTSSLVFRTPNLSSIVRRNPEASWVKKNLEVHKYKGLFYVSLSPSSDIKTHDHASILFVGVPFLWYAKWTGISFSCRHPQVPGTAYVSSQTYDSLAKIEGKQANGSVEKCVTYSVLDGYVFTKLQNRVDTLPGGITWEDIHNLELHPSDFVPSGEFEGVPVTYIRAILGLKTAAVYIGFKGTRQGVS
jgi:hypothetical protein